MKLSQAWDSSWYPGNAHGITAWAAATNRSGAEGVRLTGVALHLRVSVVLLLVAAVVVVVVMVMSRVAGGVHELSVSRFKRFPPDFFIPLSEEERLRSKEEVGGRTSPSKDLEDMVFLSRRETETAGNNYRCRRQAAYESRPTPSGDRKGSETKPRREMF